MNNLARRTMLLAAGLLVLAVITANAQSTDRKPVLLVRDSSKFKDLLADEIAEAAVEAGLTLTVEDSVGILKKARLENYSGLIVINTGMAGKMKRQVRDILKKPENLPRTVVLTTYSSPATSRDVYSNNPSVDGITSASLTDENAIRSLAREIITPFME